MPWRGYCGRPPASTILTVVSVRLRCPWGGSDHCPSQAPPCRILWETWLIGHGGIAHPRTILEGAQIWNHSRLGPSIEGASPCESS